MKIKMTSVYVDDQDKALRFIRGTGLCQEDRFQSGPYRWLTVASPEERTHRAATSTEQQSPTAKTYQQADVSQGQPAAMFFTDDIKGDYERSRLAAPSSPATHRRDGIKIAMLKTPRQPHSAHPTRALFTLRRRR